MAPAVGGVGFGRYRSVRELRSRPALPLVGVKAVRSSGDGVVIAGLNDKARLTFGSLDGIDFG